MGRPWAATGSPSPAPPARAGGSPEPPAGFRRSETFPRNASALPHNHRPASTSFCLESDRGIADFNSHPIRGRDRAVGSDVAPTQSDTRSAWHTAQHCMVILNDTDNI